MVLRRLLQPAGRAVDAARQLTGAAAGMAVGSATLTAGLAGGTALAGVRAARSATWTSAEIVTESARLTGAAGVRSARLARFVLGGADPCTVGTPEQIDTASRAVFDPDPAPQRPRVWTEGDHAHVEIAASDGVDRFELASALRGHLERLDGVDWASVNDVVGRVLVAFDRRRIGLDDIVGAVTTIEQARGARHVRPERAEHPADVEPLLEAAASVLINGTAAGAAWLGKLLPVPALTRHATAVLAFVDTRPELRRALTDRFGASGAELVLAEANAVVHVLTQSPTIPALNAVAAAQRVIEVSARRAVWQRREPQLCHSEFEDGAGDRSPPPGERPVPLPSGPIESYLSRLAPGTLAGAAGLLALTRAPSRSADLLKSLSPKAALLGREAFAAVLDLLLCRRGVLPMDGSAYRRLDRVDAVVLDGDALCTGPPVVVDATADARGWDDDRVGLAATRLLDGYGDGQLALADAGPDPSDVPGGTRHRVLDRGVAVGTVTVTSELDPLAEPLLDAARAAGHRLVLTDHIGTRDVLALAHEIAAPREALTETVRRLQSDGHGVLAVSALDGTGLRAADVGVAPTRPHLPPAWGADLVTEPGLGEVWRVVVATGAAHVLSRRVVDSCSAGNALGALLAAVGSPRRGQRGATTPGKAATVVTMALGSITALWLHAQPLPLPVTHTAWPTIPCRPSCSPAQRP